MTGGVSMELLKQAEAEFPAPHNPGKSQPVFSVAQAGFPVTTYGDNDEFWAP